MLKFGFNNPDLISLNVEDDNSFINSDFTYYKKLLSIDRQSIVSNTYLERCAF